MNRLAIAIQISYMRMTGIALNSAEMIPAAVLVHVAEQLGQSPPRLASIRALYRRRRTLHDHQEAARIVLGLRILSEHGRRKLKAHLRKIVLGKVGLRDLVQEAREWLDHNHYHQQGERMLLDLAREVRREFESALRERLVPVLVSLPADEWTTRLAEDVGGNSRLEWLRTGPRSKRPQGIADHLAKVRFLKELGAEALDFGLTEPVLVALAMPVSSKKAATLGRQRSNNMLALACFLRLTFLRLNDQGLAVIDHRIADLWRQARGRCEANDALAMRRLRHLPFELAVLGRDDSLADHEFRCGTMAMLEPFVGSAQFMRTSRVAAVRAELAAQEEQVTETLAALAEFNLDATGNPNLVAAIQALAQKPAVLAAGAANPFGPTWQALLDQGDRRAALAAFRAATLMLVKRALRNGQAACGASFNHRSPEDRLISAQLWQRDCQLFARSLSLPNGPERALTAIKAQLGTSLDVLGAAVAAGALSIAGNRMVVPRIKADPELPEIATTRRQLFAKIGSVQFADLIVEADGMTQFSRTLLGRAPHGESELAML